MRRLPPCWMMLAFLCAGFPLCVHAADPDAVSPLTSYVYLDTLADPPAQPNIVSPLVSYLYRDSLSTPPDQPNVASPLVSYLYHDSLAVPPDHPNVVSPLVSYLFYDWPGDENLIFNQSAPVSFYFQPNTTSGPLSVQGRVTDTSGTGLAGATVQALVGQSAVAQAMSGPNGSYVLPALDAGVYALTASAKDHGGSTRVVSLAPDTSRQDFRLTLLPAAPPLVQTSRQRDLPAVGPLGSTLKVFDGAGFVPITVGNAPPTDRMTIVLTHGWGSSPTVWAANMATQFRANGVNASIANIVAWDWSTAAGDARAVERTPSQGVALGKALQTTLGAGYGKNVHFLGHSLGTIVNAAAANYLHGDQTAHQDVSPTPWVADYTHMTLFDHAELSRIAEAEVLFDGLTVNLANPQEVLLYAVETLQGWRPSMPVRSTWADNYISYVGFYQPNTLNVALQKAAGLFGPIQAHSYPMVWYELSLASPTVAAVGFQRTYEYTRLPGVSLTFPPSTADLVLGDAYHQVPSATDPLRLEPLPPHNVFQLIVPVLGNKADAVVQGAVNTVEFAGEVTVQIVDGVVTAGRWVAHGVNYVGDRVVRGGQRVVHLVDSVWVRLKFKTSSTGPRADGVAARGDNEPMAWLPITIPPGAKAMAFDFKVDGNPMDDLIVCGIGESNLFVLEAKYVPTNTISASRLMDVSAWAGTTNELFFGFMGGTSTNAILQIENIRFYSLEQPRLEIQQHGNAVVLSWPLTAAGYTLESTTSLTNPAWVAVTNAPTITADAYALTNSISDQSRYFRLRPR